MPQDVSGAPETPTCQKGLHLLTPDNVVYEARGTILRCLTCCSATPRRIQKLPGPRAEQLPRAVSAATQVIADAELVARGESVRPVEKESQPASAQLGADAELVVSTHQAVDADGERRFNEMYVEYRSRVVSFLLSRVRSMAIAEDLTSETFLHAWNKWPEYVEDGRILGWLCAIANSKMIDWVRRIQPNRLLPPGETNDQVLDRQVTHWASTEFIEFEDEEWTSNLLDCLTPQQRQVLGLSNEGYDAQEIAEMTGIRYGAVRALKMRALHALRSRLTVN